MSALNNLVNTHGLLRTCINELRYDGEPKVNCDCGQAEAAAELASLYALLREARDAIMEYARDIEPPIDNCERDLLKIMDRISAALPQESGE